MYFVLHYIVLEVEKNMSNRRIDLYIDEDVINIARLEKANISQITSTLLGEYFKTQDLEKLKDEKKKYYDKIAVLDKRIEDLKVNGVTEDQHVEVFNRLDREFKDKYIIRRKNIGYNSEADFVWLTAEKNAIKLKMMSKNPITYLEELESWYKNEVGNNVLNLKK